MDATINEHSRAKSAPRATAFYFFTTGNSVIRSFAHA